LRSNRISDEGISELGNSLLRSSIGRVGFLLTDALVLDEEVIAF
jgi:hypothetical protein